MDILAATDGGEQIGKNIGELLQSWATWLYTGIAAIVAVIFLFNRRFAELAVFVGAAVVVGGFVIAPHAVHDAVASIWQSIAG